MKGRMLKLAIMLAVIALSMSIVLLHKGNSGNPMPSTVTINTNASTSMEGSVSSVPSRVRLSSNDFRMFPTCFPSVASPVYANGSYLLLYPASIPVSSGDMLCRYSFMDVDQKSAQKQKGFSFTGTFVINGSAPNTFDEEVVTAVDDNVNWTGQEYGFRASLSDGIVYGYVQDGTKRAGEWTYFYSVPLFHDDNMPHNFSANVITQVNSTNLFYFYVDGRVAGVITHDSKANYSDQSYHMIITTHRWDNGWNSSDSSLYVQNLTVLK
ncbi:MAG: hypothetical protein KGH50_03925 [Candidatus Micrarchaeota archaeon]|nr:hypothetical protein [Candidatus Micrarchaeota archaeon]